MNYRTWIPNAFTFSNLACGIISILFTMQKDFFYAALFILLAMVADAMDGRAARYFGVSGRMGEELDSLCDMSTFGVASAVLVYQAHLSKMGLMGLAAIVVFALCVCYRLARFNVNTSTVKGFFMGMPCPAGGCLLATFILADLYAPIYIIFIGTVLFSYLMVSDIKYPDFKGKGNPIKRNSVIITALLIAYVIYLIPTSQLLISILFLIFFSYAVLGIVNYFYCILFVKD